jgi:hypothetical protein
MASMALAVRRIASFWTARTVYTRCRLFFLRMVTVGSTPSPANVVELPQSAIIGIVVGGVVLVVLISWLYFFCSQYCFYLTPRDNRPPTGIYSNSQDNDCMHMACTNCNRSIIDKCCPSLDTTPSLYKAPDQLIQVDGVVANSPNQMMMGHHT